MSANVTAIVRTVAQQDLANKSPTGAGTSVNTSPVDGHMAVSANTVLPPNGMPVNNSDVEQPFWVFLRVITDPDTDLPKTQYCIRRRMTMSDYAGKLVAGTQPKPLFIELEDWADLVGTFDPYAAECLKVRIYARLKLLPDGAFDWTSKPIFVEQYSDDPAAELIRAQQAPGYFFQELAVCVLTSTGWAVSQSWYRGNFFDQHGLLYSHSFRTWLRWNSADNTWEAQCADTPDGTNAGTVYMSADNTATQSSYVIPAMAWTALTSNHSLMLVADKDGFALLLDTISMVEITDSTDPETEITNRTYRVPIADLHRITATAPAVDAYYVVPHQLGDFTLPCGVGVTGQQVECVTMINDATLSGDTATATYATKKLKVEEYAGFGFTRFGLDDVPGDGGDFVTFQKSWVSSSS